MQTYYRNDLKTFKEPFYLNNNVDDNKKILEIYLKIIFIKFNNL